MSHVLTTTCCIRCHRRYRTDWSHWCHWCYWSWRHRCVFPSQLCCWISGSRVYHACLLRKGVSLHCSSFLHQLRPVGKYATGFIGVTCCLLHQVPPALPDSLETPDSPVPPEPLAKQVHAMSNNECFMPLCMFITDSEKDRELFCTSFPHCLTWDNCAVFALCLPCKGVLGLTTVSRCHML